MHKVNPHTKLCFGIIVLCLLNIVTVVALSSNVANADSTSSASSTASVTVPEACTMTSHNDAPHTATLSPNTYSGASGSEYQNGIGKTTLTATCNDDNGFAIYAIGFTGNSYDSENHTKLVGSNTNGTIATKAYQSGDTTSNWSMKVTKVTDSSVSYNPTNMSIQNSFDSWHTVPDTYTKVAQYHASTGSSTTDNTLGAKVETTYAAYIAENQSADTYIGQVKYTMVHPYNEIPVQPQIPVAGCINYFANAANVEGTMGCQSATDGNTVKLFASNYSREGYGFAGWSDKFDYATNDDAEFYGPNESIVVPDGTTANGLALYAIWIKSAGNFQDLSKVSQLCGTGENSLTASEYNDEGDSDESTWTIYAGLSSVSALTDTRDGQTYAIAKLTDGKCWMIENLRLAGTHQEGSNIIPTTLTKTNTNNPLNDGNTVVLKHNYSDNITYTNLSAASSDATSWCNVNSADCDDQSRIRTDNTVNRASYATLNTNMSNQNVNLYSYGNYYNWYSATAGNGTYGKSSGNTVGDICPYGWHLPTGKGSGEFGRLSNSLGGYKNASNVAQQMSSSTSPTATIILQRLRHFPNNLLYSGYVNGATLNTRDAYGYYWSSTADNNNSAFDLYFYYATVSPGSVSFYKRYGRAVRCIAGPTLAPLPGPI